jgi:ferrochelatase
VKVAALLFGSNPLKAGGRGPAAGQTVEKIRELKSNLYMITGGGANTLVRVTPDGLIVVDTKNPGDVNYTRVMEEIAAQNRTIRVTTVQPFFADPDYIEVLHRVSAPYLAQPHDHVLFSYHGLPERHMREADSSHAHCLTVPDCCNTCSPAHATCYRAQSFATTRALVARAGIPAGRHSLSFQSRLAGEPWLSPYTDEEFERLPKTGVKRLLVLSPEFTADCLETLEELQQQGRDAFLAAGGEWFQQIPCPNDHPAFIDVLAKRVRQWLSEDRV